MKAARIHGYGDAAQLRIEQVPRPTAGPRDLLVQAHATSINPIDWKIRLGTQRAVIRPELPAVLGMDLSGVVVARGSRVSTFRVGDEVFASPRHGRPGTYAEYVAVDEREAAPKPPELTHLEAASIPLVGLTAWGCLVTAGRVSAGDRVFIQAGSGGVGTFAIQLAKHLGAVVSTTCSARNFELVHRLGADRAIDYTTERFWAQLEPQDLAIDAFGGPDRTRLCDIVRPGGRLVTINSELPRYGAEFGPYLGFGWSVGRLLGFAAWAHFARQVRFTLVLRRPDGEILRRIGALLSQGVIKPVIDRVYPLAEIADAHRYGETGRARGKIVIAIRPA